VGLNLPVLRSAWKAELFSGNNHTSILGADPAVAPENVALIGICDIDRGEREFINRSGITAFTMRDIDKLGMSEVSRRALEVVNAGTAGFHPYSKCFRPQHSLAMRTLE